MELNLHLHLERNLIVFDTETTGVDTARDRIIEIGLEVWTADGLQTKRRTLVNPGIPIPAGASKVHGITDAKLKECRTCQGYRDLVSAGEGLKICGCERYNPPPTFKQLAPDLAKAFSNCDFAGKNVRFDLRLMQAEMNRAGVAWTYEGAYIVDAERLEQLAEPRTLSDLYRKYTGQELEGAHGALADVEASRIVIHGQLSRYEKLPRTPKELHQLQWPGLLDLEGKFRLVDGIPICTFGKWRNYAMWDIEPSYWNWILNSDFPADVKQLARDAKMGKFPGKRP